MKLINRFILLGFIFIFILTFLISQLLSPSLFVCRTSRGDDDLDPVRLRLSDRESSRAGNPLDAGQNPYRASTGDEPQVDLEARRQEEKRIDKVRELAMRQEQIQKERQADKPEPIWPKITTSKVSREEYIIPFHLLADQRQLYKEAPADLKVLDQLMNSLSTSPIVDVAEIEGGTQIKLNLSLADGTRALFKPARFGRDATANPNHYYFSDMERHVSEIAAHHLDRLLGFRRVPPCAGRLVNLTHDIKRLADEDLYKTFFKSPVGNTCFMSHCDYYCDSAHAICGSPDLIEGSMCVYLPESAIAPREKIRHPWRRSYSKHRQADWETDNEYCANVTSRPMYENNKRRMLDLIDMAVFDFLISNLDRHHYENFEVDADDVFTIMLDNGKGFGQPNRDEYSILAPLYQCCFIRLSTLLTLVRFHDGPPHLSDAMRKSLARDRLPEVLVEGHLKALDRRVRTILSTVHECLDVTDKTNQYIDTVMMFEDL